MSTPRFAFGVGTPPIALISTVKNENGPELLAFLESIVKQTRKPDIIVIVDGDSTDGTMDVLRQFAVTASLNVWVHTGDYNRSAGRNVAIMFAINELGTKDIIIACTNVSVLDPMWLERITDPIEYSDIDLVGGFWTIPTRTEREEAMALLTQWSAKQVREPSALSMAFTAEVWNNAGGFPEELDTSEDTEFVRRVRALAICEVFEPSAIVKWRPKTLTLWDATKTYYKYAVTDGEAGLVTSQYGATYVAYLSSLAMLTIMPWLGATMLLGWLGFRVRKVIRKGLLIEVPYAMAAALAMDLARMVGFVKGRLHARFNPDS